MNAANKLVAQKKKASKGKDACTAEIAAVTAIKDKIATIDTKLKELQAHLKKKLWSVGNLVCPTVPVSQDEEHNKVVRTWGEVPDLKIDGTPGHMHHHEILAAIDGFDQPRGTKIAGHRGYFLKGPGTMLNMALQNAGLRFLTKRDYNPMYTPFFMGKKPMSETCQLSDFEDALYKVSGNSKEEEFFLIATSEQPISAFYRGEWLNPKDLPQRLAGYSSCFRKEAGAHGKDTWGIFRIHQFEKIEQFVICKPENSWKLHEEMIKTSREFYEMLELPYRVRRCSDTAV